VLPVLGTAPLVVGASLALVPSLSGPGIQLPLNIQQAQDGMVPIRIEPRLAKDALAADGAIQLAISVSAAASNPAAKPSTSPDPQPVAPQVSSGSAPTTVNLQLLEDSGLPSLTQYVDALHTWTGQISQATAWMTAHAQDVDQSLMGLGERLDALEGELQRANEELARRVQFGSNQGSR
jgi:hypothetical protein